MEKFAKGSLKRQIVRMRQGSLVYWIKLLKLSPIHQSLLTVITNLTMVMAKGSGSMKPSTARHLVPVKLAASASRVTCLSGPYTKFILTLFFP